MLLSVSSVILSPPTTSFVRGYNTSGVTVAATLSNNDSIDVAYLSNRTRQNFVIGIFLTSASTSTINVDASNYTSLTCVLTDPTLAQQAIAPGASLAFTVTFPDNILVPRDVCAQRKWLCIYVTPGTGSSYSATSTDVIQCINVTFIVNCQGK